LKGAIFGVATAGTLVMTGPALAQDAGTDGPPPPPMCGDTTLFPNPIYITGSTAFQPVVQAMGAQLANRAAGKVTLLYHQGSGSCAGAAAVKDQTDLSGNAAYFVAATGTPSTCVVPAGTKADVAVSDVFYETCGFGARPTNLGDFPGPAQAMLIVVPYAASSAVPSTITAEEAADVWGCGARGAVAPWIVESAIQQRSQASGTQNVIARSINVLASSFHGTSNTGTGNVVNSLLNMDNDPARGAPPKPPYISIANPDTAIGFIAADAYDTTTNRARLRALAFRGFDQTMAFYADSDAVAYDKKNVRDGHYLPWGYEHLLVRVDTAGKPTTQQAQNFVDWVLGNATTSENAPNFDPVQIEAANHVIPLCAMKVQRKADGGFLSAFTPVDPCNCAFESTLQSGAAVPGCTVCTDDAPCAATSTHCHHGFCE
jgi:ABC-type phosphate transport system substrate-binding protein